MDTPNNQSLKERLKKTNPKADRVKEQQESDRPADSIPIVEGPTISEPIPESNQKKYMVYAGLIMLGVVLSVLAWIYAPQLILEEDQQAEEVNVDDAEELVTLSATPSTIILGEETNISFSIDASRSNIIGGDFVVLFDPKFISVSEVVPSTEVFDDFPIITINEGEIRISGLVTEADYFSGKGEMFSIKASGRVFGTTTLTIQTEEGNLGSVISDINGNNVFRSESQRVQLTLSDPQSLLNLKQNASN